jgi:hypothetical protein
MTMAELPNSGVKFPEDAASKELSPHPFRNGSNHPLIEYRKPPNAAT